MAPARRATANVDAQVWKSYVAARIDTGAALSGKPSSALARTRKRVKPTSMDAAASPPSGTGFNSKHQLATRANVRAFWEALTVAERLQILLVDDPDIVKQLYKLNLSLLCVGLMQRHLKAGSVRAVSAATATSAAASLGTATTSAASKTSSVASIESKAFTATTSAVSVAEKPPAMATQTEVASEASGGSDSERTYDLLEAMEFMDIGTGILTVKTELVEDVDHMFSLVTAVLHGFLASIHILSESQFHDLFVAESEVINTWEDYERLIAMLVEQLMLRSYVAHLEKQATEQMEALLLEASLEDKPGSKLATGLNAAVSSQKKKKKKKKSKSKANPQVVSSPSEPAESMDTTDSQNIEYGASVHSESEPEQEDINEAVAVEDFTCQSECSTEDADLSGPSSPAKSIAKSLNRLNPHARAFEPSFVEPVDELRSPTSGKRKLDDFIIHIPWQDLVDECDDEDDITGGTLANISGELGCRRPREKYRRREEEDAELEWHLQHIYASTSSLFGWDFNEQREIVPIPSEPWVDASLWRTDPREVVRYYFPPTDHTSAFASTAFQPPPSSVAAVPSAAHASRFYYTPPEPHAPRTPTTAATPPPRGAPASVAASMFPPFMAPPNGAPVSFWSEPSTPTPAASTPAYPPLFEPQPYPKFRPTKPPSRRGKLTSHAHTGERR